MSTAPRCGASVFPDPNRDSDEAELPAPVQCTTLMVRSLPRRCTQHCFLQSVKQCAPDRPFDYLYLPWEHRRKTGSGCGFVNFIAAGDAEHVRQKLCSEGLWLVGHGQRRVVKVYIADLQGAAENLYRFVQTTLEGAPIEYCPIVLATDGRRLAQAEAIAAHCPDLLAEISHPALARFVAAPRDCSDAHAPELLESSDFEIETENCQRQHYAAYHSPASSSQLPEPSEGSGGWTISFAHATPEVLHIGDDAPPGLQCLIASDMVSGHNQEHACDVLSYDDHLQNQAAAAGSDPVSAELTSWPLDLAARDSRRAGSQVPDLRPGPARQTLPLPEGVHDVPDHGQEELAADERLVLFSL